MKHCRKSIKCVVSAAIVGLLAGCGGLYDAGVSGLVTLDGNPLPRGTVAFNPQTPGPPSYGQIDSSGHYTVMTGREEGLPSGSYVLTVVANEPPTVEGKDGGPPPAGKPITPRWYRSQETSGLSFTVEPGSNEFNLELSTQPPAGWKDPLEGRSAIGLGAVIQTVDKH